MNFNFFKKQETVKSQETNPAEEIKNTTELENSQEEEISPERIEALQEFDNEFKEIVSLKEEDLKDSIENPEEKEDLKDKLSTLSKISEILKDHYPEIALAATGIASAIIALNFDVELDAVTMSAGKVTGAIATSVAAIAAVFSPLLYSWKKFNKEQDQSSEQIDNSSHEALAA